MQIKRFLGDLPDTAAKLLPLISSTVWLGFRFPTLLRPSSRLTPNPLVSSQFSFGFEPSFSLVLFSLPPKVSVLLGSCQEQWTAWSWFCLSRNVSMCQTSMISGTKIIVYYCSTECGEFLQPFLTSLPSCPGVNFLPWTSIFHSVIVITWFINDKCCIALHQSSPNFWLSADQWCKLAACCCQVAMCNERLP